MTTLDKGKLMGFRLGGDQAEDDSLAALLDAKVGEKGGDIFSLESPEIPQQVIDANGMVDFY